MSAWDSTQAASASLSLSASASGSHQCQPEPTDRLPEFAPSLMFSFPIIPSIFQLQVAHLFFKLWIFKLQLVLVTTTVVSSSAFTRLVSPKGISTGMPVVVSPLPLNSSDHIRLKYNSATFSSRDTGIISNGKQGNLSGKSKLQGCTPTVY